MPNFSTVSILSILYFPLTKVQFSLDNETPCIHQSCMLCQTSYLIGQSVLKAKILTRIPNLLPKEGTFFYRNLLLLLGLLTLFTAFVMFKDELNTFLRCCSHIALNKKVFLGECKRQTACRVASPGGYLPWPGGVPTLARGVPTLAGGTYIGQGGSYLGWGVPTLAKGVLTLARGYLPWPGRYIPWLGVPTLAGGSHLGQGIPTLAGGYPSWYLYRRFHTSFARLVSEIISKRITKRFYSHPIPASGTILSDCIYLSSFICNTVYLSSQL